MPGWYGARKILSLSRSAAQPITIDAYLASKGLIGSVAGFDVPDDKWWLPTIDVTELVTNGTFDTDLSGWTGIFNSTNTVDTGRFKSVTTTGGYGGVSRPLTLVIGKVYCAQCDYTHVDGSGTLLIGSDITCAVDRQWAPVTVNSTQTLKYYFVATISSAYIGVMQGTTATAGNTSYFDNISVKEVLDVPRFATQAEWEDQYVATSTTPRTYFDASGVQKNDLAANKMRFTYDGGRRWLELNNVTQNVITNSQGFSDWLTFGGASKIGVSGVLGVDNSIPAYQINVGTLGGDIPSGGGSAVYLTSGVDSIVPGNFTFSVWIRSVSGTSAFRLTSFDGVNHFIMSGTATTTWQRFSLSGVAVNTLQQIAVRAAFAGGVVPDILVWGVQLEQQLFASPYIPTSGSAVIRAIESLRFPAIVEAQLQRPGAMALVRGRITRNVTGGVYLALVGGAGDTGGLHVRNSNVDIALANPSTVLANSTLGSLGFTSEFAAVGAWSDVGYAVCGNAGSVGTGLIGLGALDRSKMYLARNENTGAIYYADGLYNRLAIFPTRDDARMPTLTATGW